VPKLPENEYLSSGGDEPASWQIRRRPWRVLPLALFAVIATTATMGAAAHLFWQASGHRYAEEILLQEIQNLGV
jgi:hypothetical protein